MNDTSLPTEISDPQKADFLSLIGLSGEGWEIVGCEGQGTTDYYPAVVDGVEKTPFDFDDLDDYLTHKVHKTRLTVRYVVAGCPISAEEYICRELGCLAMAIGPHTLDVYYATDCPLPEGGE